RDQIEFVAHFCTIVEDVAECPDAVRATLPTWPQMNLASSSCGNASVSGATMRVVRWLGRRSVAQSSELGTVVDSEFGERVVQMSSDSCKGDVETSRDFLVGEAFRSEFGNGGFAR